MWFLNNNFDKNNKILQNFYHTNIKLNQPTFQTTTINVTKQVNDLTFKQDLCLNRRVSSNAWGWGWLAISSMLSLFSNCATIEVDIVDLFWSLDITWERGSSSTISNLKLKITTWFHPFDLSVSTSCSELWRVTLILNFSG